MMSIYNKVREVPKNAQKTIGGGKLKGMTDINPQWRIQTLTEQFGPCGFGWYYEVTNKCIEYIGDEACAFVDINLFINYNGEWSKPIPGSGGAKALAQEKNGPYVSDECYKMATTDAISVACKQLGIGADIYWAQGRSKYSPEVAEETKKKAEPDAEDAAKAREVSREEMLETIYTKYPKGSDQLANLVKYFNVDSLEKASTVQLIAVFDKCKK